MFCKKCGKEINDDAVVCVHCGCAVEKEKTITSGEPKNTTGGVMGFFLGLIGLIIGMCLYPERSIERETFIQGWIKGFVASIITGIIFGIIYGCSIATMIM